MFGLCRRLAGLFVLAVQICIAAPATTPIRDVLYGADGTPLNGIVVITWPAFTAANGTVVPASSLNISVSDGDFSTDLIPTTNALSPAAYSVRIIADGRDQTTETWSVPPSQTPLTISVLLVTSSSPGGVITPVGQGSTVQIGDVSGLAAELSARPVMGEGYTASRAAVIDATGAISAATGDPSDCVKVDGTSAPCGGGTGTSAAFVDAEVPGGVVDGANMQFALSQSPSPAGSLMLERNGLVLQQGSDYTLSGSTVTFQSAATPQQGDVLQASYRVGGSGTDTDSGTLTGNLDGNASTATAFQTTPTGCTAPSTWAQSQSASGNFTCTQPAASDISGLGTAAAQNTGTSGATVPLLNANNWFSGTASFTGGLSTTQAANGADALYGKRYTDSAATGNLMHFQNAATSADLWTVDVTGSLQTGVVPGARVSGNISGNAATATALASTPNKCAPGTFPLGVDGGGNAQNCTTLPATIAGTANQISASASTGAVVLSFPSGGVTLPGTTTGSFSGPLTGNVSGTATAFASTPTGCTTNSTWARSQSASGNFTCTQPSSSDLSDNVNVAHLNAANSFTGVDDFGANPVSFRYTCGVGGCTAGLLGKIADGDGTTLANGTQHTVETTTTSDTGALGVFVDSGTAGARCRIRSVWLHRRFQWSGGSQGSHRGLRDSGGTLCRSRAKQPKQHLQFGGSHWTGFCFGIRRSLSKCGTAWPGPSRRGNYVGSVQRECGEWSGCAGRERERVDPG